jgi:hypothetical protein
MAATPSAEIAATLQIVKAVADTIRDLGSVPSGHLYAQLMSSLTLEQYQRVIDLLKRAGLVKEVHYELTWIGTKGDTPS